MNNAERPSDELVEKMAVLIRNAAAAENHVGFRWSYWHTEAKEIAAELPKPIDPDLIEARKLAASIIRRHSPIMAHDIEQECGDQYAPTVHVMAGIKRGRALAKQEAGL